MDDLTISEASAIQQSQVRNKIDVAVARKALDVQQQQGDAAVALIKQAMAASESINADGGFDGYA
ncbi:MAG: putative motility protein [Phycisphaerales bacterium]